MSTRRLLAEYAVILNRYGPDSEEVTRYVDANRANMEFVSLAMIARMLKRALQRTADS